jgi:hypothetical protein
MVKMVRLLNTSGERSTKETEMKKDGDIATENTTTEDRTTIDGLNELLRGELSAVETYNQALEAVGQDAAGRKDLEECQLSHEERVLKLRSEILERGGDPAKDSGVWGAFAKLVEGGAKVGGPKMAIGALEAGEDHGLKEYHEVLPKLELSARSFVSMDLYPQQVRTHSVLSALKSALSGAGAHA